MLGIMTRPAVNRQDTLNLLYAETGWISHQYDDKLSGVYYNPVRFCYKPANMGGVISTQDLGYHPYYKKLVNQQCDSM